MDGRALIVSLFALLIVSLLWYFTDPMTWQLRDWSAFILICASFSVASTMLFKFFADY